MPEARVAKRLLMTDKVELTLTLDLPKGAEVIVTIRKDEDGIIWICNEGGEVTKVRIDIGLKRKLQ